MTVTSEGKEGGRSVRSIQSKSWGLGDHCALREAAGKNEGFGGLRGWGGPQKVPLPSSARRPTCRWSAGPRTAPLLRPLARLKGPQDFPRPAREPEPSPPRISASAPPLTRTWYSAERSPGPARAKPWERWAVVSEGPGADALPVQARRVTGRWGLVYLSGGQT